MVGTCPGLSTAAACAALFTLYSTPALAADIRVVSNGVESSRAIVIEGPIVAGDHEEFTRAVKEYQGAVAEVHLFTSGGDFTEAMKIGRAIRALELSSRVPARNAAGGPSCSGSAAIEPRDQAHCTCASACFFIHVAGTDRRGDYLAVHRPSFPTGAFGRMAQKDAMKAFDALQRTAAEYMDDMGVPRHVQEEVLGTPSDRTLLLDDKTIRTYFSGDLPYRDEWTRNRCSSITTAEPDCILTVQNESRLAAYEKYFGVRPSALAGLVLSEPARRLQKDAPQATK
jgi:hypothetical protein